MKPQDLIHKALQAKASAQLLLDAGDYDGACDRAYYAMFNADLTRTHNGLITAFSLQLVKTGRVPVELGKALNKAEEL